MRTQTNTLIHMMCHTPSHFELIDAHRSIPVARSADYNLDAYALHCVLLRLSKSWSSELRISIFVSSSAYACFMSSGPARTLWRCNIAVVMIADPALSVGKHALAVAAYCVPVDLAHYSCPIAHDSSAERMALAQISRLLETRYRGAHTYCIVLLILIVLSQVLMKPSAPLDACSIRIRLPTATVLHTVLLARTARPPTRSHIHFPTLILLRLRLGRF